MQQIYFFIDDSGQLHKNYNSNYFVYAGYVFLNNKQKDSAKRKYKALNKKIAKTEKRITELKGCNLSKENKRALYNVLREYNSFYLMVDVDRIYEPLKTKKESIVRYKDYALKRIIKKVLENLIQDKAINEYEDIIINISIDQQLTATDGIYSLAESILEELKHGILNYNYGTLIKPILFSNVIVNVNYCDSKHNYLIQASDILANRIFTSYRDNKPRLREEKVNDHIVLLLP